eukprot:UN22765
MNTWTIPVKLLEGFVLNFSIRRPEDENFSKPHIILILDLETGRLACIDGDQGCYESLTS